MKIASQTFERGPIPPKSLTTSTFSGSDAMSALRNAGNFITVYVSANNKPLSNLFIATSTLSNSGAAPILPTDIYENIKVETKDPWEIVALTNEKGEPPSINLKWKRVDARTFSADPALINPGDRITAVLYLTHFKPLSTDIEEQAPVISWSSRISNMSAIVEKEAIVHLQTSEIIPLFVYVYGFGLIFLVSLFVIYILIYLHLLKAVGIIFNGSVRRSFLVGGCAILSLLASEASNSYVFGSSILDQGANNAYNLPVIITNWACIAALLVLRRRTRNLSA